MIAAAFFSKQTASIIGVGLGVGLLIVNWRRGLVYGGVAAAALAAGIGILVRTSDGWFWTYIFKLHQSHGYRWAMVPNAVLPDTFRHLWPTFAALIVATVALAWAHKLRRTDIILWVVALAGEVAAAIGFSTQWAFSNAYIPAVFFPVLAASVLSGRLLLHALDRRRWLAAIPTYAVLLGLAWQNQHIPRPTLAAFVPRPSDYVAAQGLLDRLRSVPGDLFIPFHPYYGALVGKRTFVHRMGVWDVSPGLGRPKGLDQALQGQFFSAIVLDWKARPGEFPFVDSRYHLWRPLREGVDSVRMFAGAETSPDALLVPTLAPPPVPSGGRRLADFEDGTWQIFAVEGTAFGNGPAPAPPGMYGRFAADSTRLGPAAQGSLRSAPFTIAQSHLRFALSGPADPALRVALLDDGKPVRAAAPSGAAAAVDWDTSELVGRSVVLLVEDQSPTSGLVVDDVVVYCPRPAAHPSRRLDRLDRQHAGQDVRFLMQPLLPDPFHPRNKSRQFVDRLRLDEVGLLNLSAPPDPICRTLAGKLAHSRSSQVMRLALGPAESCPTGPNADANITKLRRRRTTGYQWWSGCSTRHSSWRAQSPSWHRCRAQSSR